MKLNSSAKGLILALDGGILCSHTGCFIPGKEPLLYPVNNILGGPQCSSGQFQEEKKSLVCAGNWTVP